MSDLIEEEFPEEEPTYELAVPFVACASQGGAYEDEAFAAGFDMGLVFQEMTTAVVPIKRYVRNESLEQLDLLAMHRGWVMRVLHPEAPDPDASEEWVEVELTKGAEVPA